jgi:hypothetical protein
MATPLDDQRAQACSCLASVFQRKPSNAELLPQLRGKGPDDTWSHFSSSPFCGDLSQLRTPGNLLT